MAKQPPPTELTFPWESDKFKQSWEVWRLYRLETHKFKYTTITSEQAAINHLSEISEGYEEIAIELILLAIRNQWKGLWANNDIKTKINTLKNVNRPLGWRR